jgi:hypothetical protein
MATVDPQPPPVLDIREQIARIDNLLIDSQKKQREHHLSVWQVVATVFGGGAAFFAAGAAFVKLLAK